MSVVQIQLPLDFFFYMFRDGKIWLSQMQFYNRLFFLFDANNVWSDFECVLGFNPEISFCE